MAMARRKAKMFRMLNNNHLESVETNWNSFGSLIKQQESMTSCYVDKLRINYLVRDASSTESFGFMFCVSTDDALDSTTPSNNDGRIISCKATEGAAGTITLDVKRRIEDNDTDINSGHGKLWLHVRPTDTGTSENIELVVESWGRWHKFVAV